MTFSKIASHHTQKSIADLRALSVSCQKL